jgi:hypothetical protein
VAKALADQFSNASALQTLIHAHRLDPGPLLQFLLEGGNKLANLSGIVKQLKQERDRVQQQLSGLNAALEAFARVYMTDTPSSPRRAISAKGRARIVAAQKARWAKIRGQQAGPKAGKRTMSPAARRKIAAAQRARWARVKAGKKGA